MKFDHIPTTYIDLLPYLLKGSLVQLRGLGPPTVLPPGYDVDAYCEFHSGAPGHTIDNCKVLKFKVQDLIDVKAITFMSNGPNINNNPTSPHADPSVSCIEEYGGKELVFSAENIKTLLIMVKEKLLMNKVYPGCGINYEHCLINPQVCEKLKAGV